MTSTRSLMYFTSLASYSPKHLSKGPALDRRYKIPSMRVNRVVRVIIVWPTRDHQEAMLLRNILRTLAPPVRDWPPAKITIQPETLHGPFSQRAYQSSQLIRQIILNQGNLFQSHFHKMLLIALHCLTILPKFFILHLKSTFYLLNYQLGICGTYIPWGP